MYKKLAKQKLKATPNKIDVHLNEKELRLTRMKLNAGKIGSTRIDKVILGDEKDVRASAEEIRKHDLTGRTVNMVRIRKKAPKANFEKERKTRNIMSAKLNWTTNLQILKFGKSGTNSKE